MRRPDLATLVLSPGNARRLAERLSQMRGAVMKVGQVHRAETHDGRVLALKVQYPGVRRSIASDMANLALLARTPGLVPAGLDPGAVLALLARAQAQLEHETDYRAEVRAAQAYREALGPDRVLTVPAVVPEHCTDHIIATEFFDGLPIDRLAQDSASQARRDHAAAALSRLAVHEFFRMRLVQTDPNFGNHLFDPDSGRIALIDFGATQAVACERVEQLRELGRALRADVHRRRRRDCAARDAGQVPARRHSHPPATLAGELNAAPVSARGYSTRGAPAAILSLWCSRRPRPSRLRGDGPCARSRAARPERPACSSPPASDRRSSPARVGRPQEPGRGP